jgi:glycosyltransferase involved in cell wall biosynthesis
MKSPLVTVIVAAYNEERHIAQCIESLLQQSYVPIEIIVVDDGSTDNTTGVVEQLGSGIRLLTLDHRGKADAVNSGAAAAAGEILLFLDGDMFFEKDYVTRMVAPIISGDCIGTTHADEYVANQDNIWSACFQTKAGLSLSRRFDTSPEDLRDGSTVYRAIKKDRFLSVNGFDNTGFLDDQTLYPKLKQKARFVQGAVCYHYNPETLGEVFSSGIWGGKSIAYRYGFKAALSHSPLPALFHALRTGIETKDIRLAVYEATHRLGLFFGITSLLLSIEKRYGK